jgi:D-alanyl-lipoteichoic acid acyltransferase DltB (MBOAT superfamily)
LNLFTVFLISGLWHGANWTFIIWGALHGGYLILEIILYDFLARVKSLNFILRKTPYLNFVRIVVTFHLVCVAWMFFRANSVEDVGILFSNLFTDKFFQAKINIVNFSIIQWGTIVLSIILLEAFHIIQKFPRIIARFEQLSVFCRWSLYYLFMIFIILFGKYNTQQFIYFQF